MFGGIVFKQASSLSTCNKYNNLIFLVKKTNLRSHAKWKKFVCRHDYFLNYFCFSFLTGFLHLDYKMFHVNVILIHFPRDIQLHNLRVEVLYIQALT